MTTTACKEFLSKNAALLGEPLGQTWKRIAKTNQNGLTLRKFQNANGRIVTLAEQDNHLFIAEANLKLSESDAVFGQLFVGKNCSEEEVTAFLVECIVADPSNVNADAYTHAIETRNWDVNYSTIDSDAFEENLVVHLPYEGQPARLTRIELAGVYELHMTEYDTRYRFPMYLTKDGFLYLGENNPD